jgi:hypothetical protein
MLEKPYVAGHARPKKSANLELFRVGALVEL